MSNPYAEEARERKAHTLAAIFRQAEVSEPSDQQIRQAAQGVAIRRPSDETCDMVRRIVASLERSDATADELLAGMGAPKMDTPGPARPTMYMASIDYGEPGVALTTVLGVFEACRTQIAGTLATAAAMAANQTIATEYIDAQTAVNNWSETAPTCGTDWEIFADTIQAQITRAG